MSVKRIKVNNEAINANNVDNNLIYAEAFDNLLIDFAKINKSIGDNIFRTTIYNFNPN